MTAFAVDRTMVIERLADEAGPLTRVLDQVAWRSDGARALRMGRKGETLTRAELVKGLHDRRRLQKVLAGVPEDGREMIVMLQHAAEPFLADPSWQGHPVVTEISAEILRLASLIVVDPALEDPSWEIREQVDHIKDLLTTLQREIDHSALDDPRLAVGFVLEELQDVDQKELARLLGYASDRSLRDLRAAKTKDVRKNGDRVVLVAQIVYDLRSAMSPHGMLAWFRRGRHQLGGRAPIELIDESATAADAPLRALARGVRGQLAT